MKSQNRTFEECTVLAIPFESRGRQDCLVQMPRSSEIRMRHLLRIPTRRHAQVAQIIDRLQRRLNQIKLPSIVAIDTHGSAGRRGYYIYSKPLAPSYFATRAWSENYFVNDPLRYILRVAQQLQLAARHKLFHQTLSPSLVHYDGHDQFLLLGLGIPALRPEPTVFMAPELVEGGRANDSTTIYALSMMLFALYGGCFMLGGDDRFRQVNRPFLEDNGLKIHPDTKTLIYQSSSAAPEHRPATLNQFCRQLSAIIEQERIASLSLSERMSALRQQVQQTWKPVQPAPIPITGAHLIPVRLTD